MATKPIIKPITPFDANIGYRITATYSGNMPYYNRVEIQDAITQVVVYARTIQSSEYAHTLDPSYTGTVVAPGDVGYSLINGRRYTATIQFFGQTLSDAGLVSDKAIFLTRTTPQFYFDDLNDGDIIEAASITLNIHYEQREGEKLLNFRFYIYNNNKSLLQQTDIMYDTTDLSYTFKGLENETAYYVRAVATTVNGILLDTGMVEIIVRYQNPSVYARMYVECDPDTSEMNYRTNFVLIEADEGDDFKYEDGYIFLDEGQTVTYSKGFEIEGDATWHIRAKDMDYERVFFKCLNANGEFYLEGIRDTDMTLRFRLVVPSACSDYILYSQRVNIDWTDVVNIWIRRINNIYSLKVFVELHPLVQGALYLEDYEPTNPYMAQHDIWINMNETPGVEVLANDVVVYHQDTEPQNAQDYNIWID